MAADRGLARWNSGECESPVGSEPPVGATVCKPRVYLASAFRLRGEIIGGIGGIGGIGWFRINARAKIRLRFAKRAPQRPQQGCALVISPVSAEN